MESNKSSESERTPKGNVFRNAERNAKADSGSVESTPEAPSKRSATKQFFKRMGYSVWLIVMVVGGGLAFITFLFLI